MKCSTCGFDVGCGCSKQWKRNSFMKWVWGFLVGAWIVELLNLFLAQNSGTAMPWQPFVGMVLGVGGLCFFLALHILIRVIGGKDRE